MFRDRFWLTLALSMVFYGALVKSTALGGSDGFNVGRPSLFGVSFTDPREADVGSILGFGFAPFTGGTLSYIDFMGARKFVELCHKLEAKYGSRFTPPKLSDDEIDALNGRLKQLQVQVDPERMRLHGVTLDGMVEYAGRTDAADERRRRGRLLPGRGRTGNDPRAPIGAVGGVQVISFVWRTAKTR